MDLALRFWFLTQRLWGVNQENQEKQSGSFRFFPRSFAGAAATMKKRNSPKIRRPGRLPGLMVPALERYAPP